MTMAAIDHPNPPFRPLGTVCKKAFPFTVACPSFVYPAGYVDNVRHLAPFVDEIQLLFFESRPQSIPSPDLIRDLASLANHASISYHVHLPTDIDPGHPDPAQRRRAIDALGMLMERCEPLQPSTYTLHLARPADGAAILPVDQWQTTVHDSLEQILARHHRRRQISVETLDYPFELVAPVISALDLSVCMDMGHLLLHGGNMTAFFDRWQKRISVIHLHGVQAGRDHLPLDRLSDAQMKTICGMLKSFRGVLCLEVYSQPALDASMARLADLWLGPTAHDT
jgi:sugar phosphate isomerase/epimerase